MIDNERVTRTLHLGGTRALARRHLPEMVEQFVDQRGRRQRRSPALPKAAIRSNSSARARLGKTPSSMPSRQTTRYGKPRKLVSDENVTPPHGTPPRAASSRALLS